ncbi:hypothetical protein KsCSTR_04380 [Candidatus Kuenenia stuttgartiensis]|uniref:Uncharacterized protein n=1 Tax=Kuenenia stuttgartiensis TaxID=174633 RepID=Q1Q0F2_KUEST|nr:hypothetical protein KsCSTR_04380 [Candidatus Kuenenia stuttgartiensis]CAJ72803.1 unknown protein [Candidatus Kuenenia stuttgartiensis]
MHNQIIIVFARVSAISILKTVQRMLCSKKNIQFSMPTKNKLSLISLCLLWHNA